MAAKMNRRKPIDLKYKFIRGLIKHEYFRRTRHFDKQAADGISKAIVSLDLSFEVFRSVKQATQLKGIGCVLGEKLKMIKADKDCSASQPKPGKFASSATALLVGMYMIKKELEPEAKGYVPQKRLREVAAVLAEERFIEEEKLLNNAFCQATWRLTVLANQKLIKKRSKDKQPVYEMFPAGEELALHLIVSRGLQFVSLDQLMSGEPLVLEPAALPEPPQNNNLYGNDDGSDGVVLQVDIREGGGDHKSLSDLCKKLDRTSVRYATKHLQTGDYAWVWNSGGTSVELPVIIERKRADDLAESMRDERYERQKTKMLQWREKFDKGTAQLLYVVEGDPQQYVLRCADACGGVGKCHNPTVEQVEQVIDDLRHSVNFNLCRTENLDKTIELLLQMTEDLQIRVDNGEFSYLADDLEQYGSASPPRLLLSHSSPKRRKVEQNPCAGSLHSGKMLQAPCMDNSDNISNPATPPKQPSQYEFENEHDFTTPLTPLRPGPSESTVTKDSPRCRRVHHIDSSFLDDELPDLIPSTSGSTRATSEPAKQTDFFNHDSNKLSLDPWANEVQQIKIVLPQVDEDIARVELEKNGGDPNQAISALLDYGNYFHL